MNPKNGSLALVLLLVFLLLSPSVLSEKKISVAVNLNGSASGDPNSPALAEFGFINPENQPVSGLSDLAGELSFSTGWMVWVKTKNLPSDKFYKISLWNGQRIVSVGRPGISGAVLNSTNPSVPSDGYVLLNHLTYDFSENPASIPLLLEIRELPNERLVLKATIPLGYAGVPKATGFDTHPSVISSDDLAVGKLWLTNLKAGLAGVKDQVKSVRFRQCPVNAPPAPDAPDYKFIVPEVCSLSMPISTAPIDEPPGYNILDFYEPATTSFRSQVVSLVPTIEVSANSELKAVDGEPVLVTDPQISKLAISVFDKNKKPIQMIQPADGPIMVCFRVLPDEPAISQDFRVQLFVNNQMVFNGFEETPADYFSRYLRLKNAGFSDCWSSGPFFSDYLTGESNANSNGLNWNVNEWDSLSGDVDWKKALFNLGANPFPSPFASSSATLGGASGMAFPMDVPVGNKVRIRVALLSKSNEYMALGQQDFSVLSQAITFVPDRINVDSPPEKIEVLVPAELAKGVNRSSLDLSLIGCNLVQCVGDQIPKIELAEQVDGSLKGEILYGQLSKLKQFFSDYVKTAEAKNESPAELEVKVTATSGPAEPASEPNPDFLDDPPGYLPAEALVLLSQKTVSPFVPQEISVPKAEGFELALYSIDPATRKFRELPFLANVAGGSPLVRVLPSDFPISLGWKNPLFSWTASGFYPKAIWIDSKPVFSGSSLSSQPEAVRLLASSFSKDFFWDPSWSNPMTFGTYEPGSVLWTNNGWRGVAPSAPSPIYLWSKTRFELSVDLGSLDSDEIVGSGKILVDMPLFETYAAPATVEPPTGEFDLSFGVLPEAEALLAQNPEAEFWWWNENAIPGAPPEKIALPVEKITENEKIVWGIAKEKADALFDRVKTAFSDGSSGSLSGIVAVGGTPVQAVSLQKACSSLLECLANLDKRIISILFGGGNSVPNFVPSEPVKPAVVLPAKPTVCDGGTCYEVTLAATPQERETGLKNHPDSLTSSEGMLFVFESDSTQPFTMKGMKFPLDIVWINSDLKIVASSRNLPVCPESAADCPTYGPPMPILYALEIRAHQVMESGLLDGDQLVFNEALETQLSQSELNAGSSAGDSSGQYYQSTKQWISAIENNNECPFCTTDLIQRIIFVESSGNSSAVNGDALGLMQVRPIALQELLNKGIIDQANYDLSDPSDNIFIGTVYLDYLAGSLRLLDSRQNFEALSEDEQNDLVLEAYHVGPTAVNQKGHTPDGIAYLESLANVP